MREGGIILTLKLYFYFYNYRRFIVPNKESPYLAKNVSFNKHDKTEMKLYQKLTTLKHGEFSKRTKEMWAKEMKMKEE